MVIPDERDRTSLRIAKPLKDKLERLAKASKRTQTEWVEEALETYFELHAWQFAAVEKGVQAANKGNVYSTEEVLYHLEQLKGGKDNMRD